MCCIYEGLTDRADPPSINEIAGSQSGLILSEAFLLSAENSWRTSWFLLLEILSGSPQAVVPRKESDGRGALVVEDDIEERTVYVHPAS